MNPHRRKTFRASDTYKPEELLFRFLSVPPEEKKKLFPPPRRVAEILGKSERTINDWVSFDRIAGIRIGERKKYIYWPSVVDYLRWLQDKELAAGDAD